MYIGGSFVEGEWLRNAFHWKATVGPWEERPGHFNEVWQYWTDDGLGLFEFLQVFTAFMHLKDQQASSLSIYRTSLVVF